MSFKGKRLFKSDGDLAASMPVHGCTSAPMFAGRRQVAPERQASFTNLVRRGSRATGRWRGFAAGGWDAAVVSALPLRAAAVVCAAGRGRRRLPHFPHSPARLPRPSPLTPLPLQGTSMPISIPLLQRRASSNDQVAGGASTFVPPHMLQRQEGEDAFGEALVEPSLGLSPSTGAKRERLLARNAILRSTGFIEVQRAAVIGELVGMASLVGGRGERGRGGCPGRCGGVHTRAVPACHLPLLPPLLPVRAPLTRTLACLLLQVRCLTQSRSSYCRAAGRCRWRCPACVPTPARRRAPRSRSSWERPSETLAAIVSITAARRMRRAASC